jgi:hypothetical protein
MNTRIINNLPDRFTKFILLKKILTIPEFFKIVLQESQFDTYMEIYNQNIESDTNPEIQFPVDFDNLVEKMGFSRKDNAKRLLLKILTENVEYVVSTSDQISKDLIYPKVENVFGEQQLSSLKRRVTVHGGEPFEEDIKLTFNAAQKFCLKAQTKNAMDFADCFTAIIHAITDYHRLSSYINPMIFRHNELANLHRNKNGVYIVLIVLENCSKTLVKIGKSTDLFDRKNSLVTEYGCLYILDFFPSDRAHELEQTLLKLPDIVSRLYKEHIKGKSHVEIVQLDLDFNYDSLLKLVNNQVTFLKTDQVRRENLRILELENQKVLLDIEKLGLETLKQNGINSISHLKTLFDTIDSKTKPDISILKDTIKTRKNSRGYFIQKVSTLDFSIVQGHYDGSLDATRKVQGSSKTRIEFAMKNNTPYMDSRWVKVDYKLDPNISHCVEPTVEIRKQKCGLVAKLDKNSTCIKQVFQSQKEATEEAQLTSRGAISNAIKNETLSRGHLYKMYLDCSDTLVQNYEKIHGKQIYLSNANGIHIDQIDPISKKIVNQFSNIEYIIKEYGITRSTLKEAIDKQMILKSYTWNYSI